EELVQHAADQRAWRDAERGHDVVAVDREVAEREGRRRPDLLLHALPERLERVHARRAGPAPDVVGAAESEERGNVFEADLAYEPTDGRPGPLGLVPEHVIAYEVGDLDDRLLVEPPPPQDLPRHGLADELVLVEVTVGEGGGLAEVGGQTAGRRARVVGRRRVPGPDRWAETSPAAPLFRGMA